MSKRSFYNKMSTCLRYFLQYGIVKYPLNVKYSSKYKTIYVKDPSRFHCSISRNVVYIHKGCSYAHIVEKFCLSKRMGIKYVNEVEVSNIDGYGSFRAPFWDTYIEPKTGIRFSDDNNRVDHITFGNAVPAFDGLSMVIDDTTYVSDYVFSQELRYHGEILRDE